MVVRVRRVGRNTFGTRVHAMMMKMKRGRVCRVLRFRASTDRNRDNDDHREAIAVVDREMTEEEENRDSSFSIKMKKNAVDRTSISRVACRPIEVLWMLLETRETALMKKKNRKPWQPTAS